MCNDEQSVFNDEMVQLNSTSDYFGMMTDFRYLTCNIL